MARQVQPGERHKLEPLNIETQKVDFGKLRFIYHPRKGLAHDFKRVWCYAGRRRLSDVMPQFVLRSMHCDGRHETQIDHLNQLPIQFG